MLGGEVGKRMGRKHLAVCSLFFLTPLWRQTGFLPFQGTLAPSSLPLVCPQPGTGEVFQAESSGNGDP